MSAAHDHHPSLDPESEEYKRKWAEGLRPHVIWLPNTKDPAFIAEVRRQARDVARRSHAAADQAFVDSISISVDELD